MNEVIPGYTTTDFSDRPNECRECGRKNNAVTSVEPGQIVPEPGSVSVCFGCGAITLFDENLKLRPPTAEELDALRRASAWPMIERASRERRAAWDRLPETGKQIAKDVERMWGHLRKPKK